MLFVNLEALGYCPTFPGPAGSGSSSLLHVSFVFMQGRASATCLHCPFACVHGKHVTRSKKKKQRTSCISTGSALALCRHVSTCVEMLSSRCPYCSLSCPAGLNLGRSYMREEEAGRAACAKTTLDPEHGATWHAGGGGGGVAVFGADAVADTCPAVPSWAAACARLKPLASFILYHFLAFA